MYNIVGTELLIIHFTIQIVYTKPLSSTVQNTYQRLDQETLKEWSDVLGLTAKVDKTNTPQSGYTQTIYGDGTTTTAKLVGYSAQGVGHTVPVHESMDLAFFGIA